MTPIPKAELKSRVDAYFGMVAADYDPNQLKSDHLIYRTPSGVVLFDVGISGNKDGWWVSSLGHLVNFRDIACAVDQ